MRRFEVITLGTGAALPARGRHPTAQLVHIEGAHYLIDCGEGTQERIRVAGVNFMSIRNIFISHLHGDHYLGLMGLVSTMHLMGRTGELHVHGPPVLEDILRMHLCTSETHLRYALRFHALSPAADGAAWEDERVVVTLLPLRHRLPTTGFVFTERPGPRNLRRDRLASIPTFRRNAVKAGEDLVLDDGTRIPNDELTWPPHPPRRYAYCSDTAPVPGLAERIRGVDLLYHEATFTAALADRARETLHSTAAQAAELARDAGVGRLLLGHFSSRYPDTGALLSEARSIFPACDAAEEGAVYPLIPRTAV